MFSHPISSSHLAYMKPREKEICTQSQSPVMLTSSFTCFPLKQSGSVMPVIHILPFTPNSSFNACSIIMDWIPLSLYPWWWAQQQAFSAECQRTLQEEKTSLIDSAIFAIHLQCDIWWCLYSWHVPRCAFSSKPCSPFWPANCLSIPLSSTHTST